MSALANANNLGCWPWPQKYRVESSAEAVGEKVVLPGPCMGSFL